MNDNNNKSGKHITADNTAGNDNKDGRIIKEKKQNGRNHVKALILGAMFTALAYAAVVILHIKVSFLTFEFKDAIMTIGAMICGPVYAVAMSVITSLIEMITISDTGLYGFIMNVLASIAFTLPASLIYHYKRNIYGAIIGTFTSIFSMTAVMLIANLIVTPYYYHMEVAGVAQMIPTLLLPFNLTKAALNAGVVLLLYKPISQTLKKARLDINEQSWNSAPAKAKFNVRTTVIATAIAVVLITASVIVFFAVLKGNVVFGH